MHGWACDQRDAHPLVRRSAGARPQSGGGNGGAGGGGQASPPGANGLIFLPYFSDELTPALLTATPFSQDLRSATSPNQRSSSGTRPHSRLSLIRAAHAFTKGATQLSASFIRASAI